MSGDPRHFWDVMDAFKGTLYGCAHSPMCADVVVQVRWPDRPSELSEYGMQACLVDEFSRRCADLGVPAGWVRSFDPEKD